MHGGLLVFEAQRLAQFLPAPSELRNIREGFGAAEHSRDGQGQH